MNRTLVLGRLRGLKNSLEAEINEAIAIADNSEERGETILQADKTGNIAELLTVMQKTCEILESMDVLENKSLDIENAFYDLTLSEFAI